MHHRSFRILTISLCAWGSYACATAQTRDSSSHPPVNADDVHIVQRAREILNSPAVWNREDTRKCAPLAVTFSMYCALEKATVEVSGSFEHRGAAMQEVRFVIDDVAPHRGYQHRLMGFNNDRRTRFEDVQNVMLLLQKRIEQRVRQEAAQ